MLVRAVDEHRLVCAAVVCFAGIALGPRIASMVQRHLYRIDWAWAAVPEGGGFYGGGVAAILVMLWWTRRGSSSGSVGDIDTPPTVQDSRILKYKLAEAKAELTETQRLLRMQTSETDLLRSALLELRGGEDTGGTQSPTARKGGNEEAERRAIVEANVREALAVRLAAPRPFVACTPRPCWDQLSLRRSRPERRRAPRRSTAHRSVYRA